MEIFLLLLLGWVFFILNKAICANICSKCGCWGTMWKDDEHLWVCIRCDYEEDATIYQDILSRAAKKWSKRP